LAQKNAAAKKARDNYKRSHQGVHAAYRAAHAAAVKQFGDPDAPGATQEDILAFYDAVGPAKRAVVGGLADARLMRMASPSAARH
jgi:hypothetical protein